MLNLTPKKERTYIGSLFSCLLLCVLQVSPCERVRLYVKPDPVRLFLGGRHRLEFGDFCCGADCGVGEQVGRCFAEVEGHEDHAQRYARLTSIF